MQKSFHLTIYEDKIAELVFDDPQSAHNILSSRTIGELEAIVENLERDRHIKALLLRSGKENFVVGASIDEIFSIENPSEAEEKSARGQALFEKISRLPFPTACAVRGLCLGGGAELALACKFRLMSDSPSTRIGFPEILLGIAPGFGGTQRLPRIVGLGNALDLILTGRQISARNALSAGLADKVFPDAIFEEKCFEFIRSLPSKEKKKGKILKFLIEKNPLARSIILKISRKAVMKKTFGNYPAPFRAIELIGLSYKIPIERGLKSEARAVGELIVSAPAKNLMRLFFLREGAVKKSVEPVRKISNVGIVGAGVMGGGIAHIVADSGRRARLKDIKDEAITQALKTAQSRFRENVKRRRISAVQAKQSMERISADTEYHGFKNLDLVIESAPEQIQIKKKIFEELENFVGKETILASNTSALSISEMGANLKNPERLIGLHFFNPVHRMPLVEIIRTEKSSPQAIEAGRAFAQSLGKAPVVVKDSPGFLVNRLLMPYMTEAALMLEEGVRAEHIERCAMKFGMPMGPFELFDEVGIDIAFHVAKILKDAFPDRAAESAVLNNLYERKAFGKKVSEGFYDYKKGKREGFSEMVRAISKGVTPEYERMIERLFYPVVNESARCLAEGVANTKDDIDLAMVMGTGFAPFRGGPLRFGETVGFAKIAERLEELSAHYGSRRFAPCEALREFAKNNFL